MKLADEIVMTSANGACRTALRAWIASVAILALTSASALAQNAPAIEGIRLGFGPEPMFRQGTWTPAWVEVKGGSERLSAQVELMAPDDDGVLVRRLYPVTLKPGETVSVAGLVRPGLLDAEIQARLLDTENQAMGRPFVLSPTERLEPYSLLVVTAGQASGVEDVPSITKYRGAPGSSPEFVVKPIEGRWPLAWFGFEGVEAVVLSASDAETLQALRGKAGRALRTWVEQGGHLVVSLGGDEAARDATAELLGDLMPAKPAGPVRLTDLGSVESFAGSGQTSSGHQLTPPMTVTKLEGWESRGGVPLAASLATPLVVRGPYGLGRVTVVGIDVAEEPFAGWKDRRFFWEKVLDIPPLSGGSSFSRPGGGAFIDRGPSDLSARLHRALEAFPEVKLVPFGWVAFFVFLYILLIGPLDYLFLRKVVKRMELTWVTFPLIVVVVSGLAYAWAFSVKGNTLRVNKVDALDYDQTTGAVRGSSWLTLFSPQNRDYGVSVKPLGPSLDPKQPPRLESGALALSWFGSPDPALGGVGRISLAGSGYRYRPESEAGAIENVRIPIWSTRSFLARWVDSAREPVIEADIEPVGGDRVAGSVRNLLGVTLSNAQLYYGRNVYDLGTIRPRGIARIDPTRTEAMTRYLGRLASSFDTQRAPTAFDETSKSLVEKARQARAGLVRAAMFHDAMGSRASANPSRPLRGLDLSAQVGELHRPMLVAEVEAPAALAELDNGRTEAEITQTTVLRVVLPVRRENPAER